MKLVLIIAGILVGIALIGFIALQIFFFIAKRWEDKDVL
jgi:uncharacterized protein YneF (UPF0154 family)